MVRIHRRTIQKGLKDSENYNSVITDLEPSEASLGTKLVEVMEFQLIFQILKYETFKILLSISQQIWKLSRDQRTGKDEFSFQSQRRAMPNKGSNYHTFDLISHASKLMLKIL